VNHPLIGEPDICGPEGENSGVGPCPFPKLVSTAWASASTFPRLRQAGGRKRTARAQFRLSPQKDWDANQPAQAGERPGRSSKRSRRNSMLRSPARKVFALPT